MAKWLLILLTLSAASVRSQTAPFESVGLNRVGPASETDKQIQTLQDHIKKAPGDYAGYDALGSAFLQKARESGDIAYFDLAEQTLKRSLALAPQDFRAADPLVHMALVYMGEHRFSDALACAQKAMGTGSGNLAAFAIEGDAYTDMGDYDEAAAAYNTLQSLGQAILSPLQLAYMSDSRMAYPVSYTHLDVYKRQHWISMSLRNWSGGFDGTDGFNSPIGSTAGAVLREQSWICSRLAPNFERPSKSPGPRASSR